MPIEVVDSEDIAKIQNPTAESLAYYLLELDENQNASMPGPEATVVLDPIRARYSLAQLGVMQAKPNEEQDVVFSKFCAKYLQVLYVTWLHNHTALNPHARMLNMVSNNVYFTRFATQPVTAYPIVGIQAHRMVVASDQEFSDMDPDEIGEMCQFLSTMIMYQGMEHVDPTDKNALITRLSAMQRVYRTGLAATTLQRCVEQLQDKFSIRLIAGTMRKHLENSLMSCGAEGCDVRERPEAPSADLMQCARCKTVRYCSADHQKASWKKHKKHCFSVSY